MNRPFATATLSISMSFCSSLAMAQDGPQRSATPGEELKVPAGFKAELLHSARPEEGSWASMTVDDKGRLYISPQYRSPKEGPGGASLFRVTLKEGGRGIERLDPVPLPVGGSMGMLWAFESLYVSGLGPDGQGIYRLRDTDGNDTLDDAKLFKKVEGGAGEHGAHAMVLGPDNHLYIAHGNSTPLVEGIADDSPHRNYQEDSLLPRIMDPVATFFDKLKVPYGYVLRTDPDGKKWELYAGGFRNQYDIDFNADGELFTFDSDMEWDVGLPWYRPTRILHVTSGAEFGFREGTAKWPAYSPDSLGAVVDIGLGSPTGVKFGTKSNFPARYKSALFALDWTYGRVLAVHMKPAGATYVAENPLPNPFYLERASSSPDVEEFLTGKAMPVSDLEFGPDGAMYLIAGGRGTQSGLYRVSYDGPIVKEERVAEDPATVNMREVRRSIEAFHGDRGPNAIESAWPHLASKDRHIRYAARIAVESQPVEQWSRRALDEKDPQAAMTGLLALARVGAKDTQAPLLKALGRFPMGSLNEPLKLEKLRVIQLSFVRQGRPADELVKVAIEKLGKQYPAKSFALNRELSQLLVWLGAPDAVEKTLALLDESKDPAEQIWYAYVLREATVWTPEQRVAYFSWFNKAASIKGGNSLPKFILTIRDRAMAKLTDDEREQVAAAVKPTPAGNASPAGRAPAAPLVVREFQKQWTMDHLTPELPKVSSGRNFERGREIFASLQCLACHRFNNEGGGVGPDISAVSSRFNRRDLLESMIEPSKVISEQYASYVIKTKKNETFVGQIVEENNDHVVVVTDALNDKREKVGAHRIVSKRMANTSSMPSNLLDVLKEEEVLDLLAYIESAGNPQAPMFGKAAATK